ncbi:chromosome partition protein Smc [Sideroxyarcus emersonii]|uniref:Chromosome partition protein Smc n=1 Tax=Sideroxyarcus emersonii TaxID=2764705 RepID=A0AAN2BYY7_9PROT|nr:AAA family ATPase [Sideroxyarcus emersonii]BCK87516.1 chromosome partition protein Smc [Sideroxyarcus emersonii]
MFRLMELETVHWDYWRNFKLPLDAPIITISGPNGSGKTTLLDAMRTLLALECSKKRDYKRYVRRNGEDFCWLRGVVDNQCPPGASYRPFRLPYQQDKITLACRIDKKGGDWSRKYWIADGEVSLQEIEAKGEEFGVRDYQRILHSAGLSPAIARVLSLEQGQTDKLCELSHKDLLDLVFQVFGDKEVLERYEEARHHQEHTARELDATQNQLEALGNNLEKHEQKVNRYLEWHRLNQERVSLVSEMRPRLKHYLLQNEADNARRTLLSQRREWRAKRAEREMLQLELQVQQQALETAQLRSQAAQENERVQTEALNVLSEQIGELRTIVNQHDQLLQQAQASEGGKVADAREIEQLEGERAGLLVRIAELEQKQRQLDEMLENLAAGRRADPHDVAAFRQALSQAGIAHDLLADVVEIADPSWQSAVEAVLAPFAHLVLLGKEKDTEAAMALGEKLRYRHFIVPDCVAAGLAPKGSLLEVVHFAKPVPEWLLRTLERTRRVEDAAAGAKLPRGEDWITRQGYLRERRGGRYAAPEQARFGKARLEALREQRGSIDKALTPLRQQLADLTARIRNQQAQLAGVSAAAQLAARAAEFADARQQYDALVLRRRDNTVLQAQQEREQADKAVNSAFVTRQKIEFALQNLEKEIAGKENRTAREEQIRRLQTLRANRRQFPAGWCDAEANRQIADKYRDTTNIDRRLEEIEYRFKEESWETDDTVVALRDKIKDDYRRMESDLASRRRDNETARHQTEAAREQYIAVLRHTVGRYVKNLKVLGDLAGIKVDNEPVALENDDLSLAQAGLAVRFNFDDKGFMGMNDGDASGGQQVMKSLILLVALMMEESRPGGFVFIDEPFAHLDIVNIERVAKFLKATRAQYLLTTPVTHNVSVYDPSMLTLVTFKKKPTDAWAPGVKVLVRERA